ncbi:hypothetical protein [Pseudomonas sp. ICMP 564]|uniref:hypothetical protein n=1 Tax=Pseudomonas sp. ICMP 564 TaxID=1718919 RepID=UPI000C06C16A|nr:hypothetical protein [Pseudomonas sp. ICMP 564]PHN38591.1 hypothetical protein AO259_07680 [Pseudomonas sp. ICMP 564]
MDWNQVRIIFREYMSAIVNSWYVIFSILGVATFIISFLVEGELLSKILFATGSLIVATGCFSAMTRWLSVHGIVKKEMQNILFGDEYLRTDQGFDVVWNKVVATSVDIYMPALGPYLHKEFLREYLPSKDELFYKEFHQTFDVYWHDKQKRIIKVKERCEIAVQCADASPHALRYGFSAEFPPFLNLKYVVTDLKIDAVCKMSAVDEKTLPVEGLMQTTIKYNIELVGSLEYRYFRSMERLICLDYEPFIQLGSSWHTYKPRVTVNCHDNGLKAYFSSTGTLRDFITVSGKNNTGYMEEQYPDLLLKAQGYTIYFSET